jgi:MerR family transcriptional regulator, heat shock protein HspR
MRKGKSKAAYMISAVAQQYEVHPQTLRLYEREGLLKPSRSDGNTRLYTDEDLERLEVILKLTREFGVNLAGVEIILNMREKMEAMQRQIEEFIATLNQELAAHIPKPPQPAHNSLIPVITLPPLQSVSSRNRDTVKGNPTTTTRRKIPVRAGGSSSRDEAE